MLRDWWQRADPITDLTRIVVIVVAALAAALLFNTLYLTPQQRAHGPTATQLPTIALAEAYELAARGEALIVDAEAPATYRREHIAGAVNLPYGELDAYYPDFARQIAKEQPLILYCEPGCMSKDLVAEKLVADGYRDVCLLQEGVAEWRAAGYPVAVGEVGQP